MSRKIDEKLAIKICKDALTLDMPEAGKKHGISKQRVSQIFHRHKSRVFFEYELTDNKGKLRSFRELKKIYNSFTV